MSWWHDFGGHKPSVPRKVKGGIRAQTAHGQFGKSWWGRRWIEVLEGFDIGDRLSRGRKYARAGQVLSIDVEKGIVRAKVQGSRKRPYQIEIRVKTLSERTSKTLAKVLARRALFTAQLLRGEMPEGIETAFKEAGASLFPKERGDLVTECSCPDWSNPCKHIAAVYYLLGEEFDRDPFLIFRMRGIERDKLVSLPGSPKGAKMVREGKAAAIRSKQRRRTPGNLPADPDKFWRPPSPLTEATPEATIPRLAAALPRQLGPFPFWRGEEQFLPSLIEVYSAASNAALDILTNESPSGESQEKTSDV